MQLEYTQDMRENNDKEYPEWEFLTLRKREEKVQ